MLYVGGGFMGESGARPDYKLHRLGHEPSTLAIVSSLQTGCPFGIIIDNDVHNDY